LNNPQRLVLPPEVDPAIEVWEITLELAQPIPVRAWADLDQGEQQLALALRRPADRVRRVATRSALRRLLAARLGCAAGQLRFRAGPHGKPQLDHACRLPFNVSHSGTHALIALGPIGHGAELGVDIEQIGRQPPEAGVLDRVLSEAERAWVAEEPAAFYRIWTAKEALLKAHGTGMRLAPDLLCLARDAADALHLCGAPAEIAGRPNHVQTLAAPSGYAAALAWIEC